MLLVHDKLLKIATEINEPKNVQEIILGLAKGLARHNNHSEILLCDLLDKTAQKAGCLKLEALEFVHGLIENHKLVPIPNSEIIKFRLRPPINKFEIYQRKLQAALCTDNLHNVWWSILKEEKSELRKSEVSLPISPTTERDYYEEGGRGRAKRGTKRRQQKLAKWEDVTN